MNQDTLISHVAKTTRDMARRELPGWDASGFDEGGWRNALTATVLPRERLQKGQQP